MVLLAITVLSVFFFRPFCKYLCPLGAIYGIFNPVSSYRLVIDKDKCVSCGTCQKACGMDIRTFETPNSPECIRCGSCMAACPAGAIESTWRKTEQKIKKRCFIDDGELFPVHTAAAAADEVLSASDTGLMSISRGKPVFLGILMLAAGVSSLGITILSTVGMNFLDHFLVEAYHDSNLGIIVMGLFWCAASIMVALTGAYAIRFSSMPERLLSTNEKLRLAWMIALIGLVIGFTGIFIDLNIASGMLSALLFDTFIYLWLVVLMIQVWLTCREIKGRKSSRILWGILSIINIPLALSSPWLVLLAMRLINK